MVCVFHTIEHKNSANLANNACAQFERDSCVCPSVLKNGMFTVGAVDIIDHNPTARNAMDSYHDTAISILPFPVHDKPGTGRGSIYISTGTFNKNKMSQLTAEYSETTPAALPRVTCICSNRRSKFKINVYARIPIKSCQKFY